MLLDAQCAMSHYCAITLVCHGTHQELEILQRILLNDNELLRQDDRMTG
jgi:hypothetical protein